MQFSIILTSLAAVVLGMGAAPCIAQTTAPTAPAAPAASAPVSPPDSVIMDMAQAFKQKDSARLTALLPAARGHFLEPWAAYWELSTRLDKAPASDIQTFFQRFAGTYQEDRLRSEWLMQLGKRRDWANFSREYAQYRMQDDKSVQCYALWADSLSSGIDNTAQLKNIWLEQKEADDACAGAAEQLLKNRSLFHTTPAETMVWQRARLGMENNRPRVVTQAVGLVSPGSVDIASAVYANPAQYLSEKLTAFQPKTREIVSLALIRLAQQDPTAAAAEMGKLRWKAQLTQEERDWIWGVIGKKAAMKLDRSAADYFANGQFIAMHDDHLAWAARAALRVERWAQVQAAIEAMSESQRSDPTWVYWRARAMLKSPNLTDAVRAQANQLLQSIASSRGFYEQLALEELGQRITVPLRPPALTQAEKDNASLNPGLVRALYAIRMGLRPEGVREWNYAISLHTKGGMDDRALLAAADFACRYEVWDRCINTSERTKTVIDAEQRFLMPFKASVLARCQQIGMDAAYVYGLIRQESRFILDAKSTVGASGLMQLMPATAKWTAKRIGLKNFQPKDVHDRDINIALGTSYLQVVLSSFENSMPMAAAAYNAGPGRVRTWRGQTGDPTLDAAIWAENIPFNETRDYVKKVVSNTVNYAALLTAQPQSLKARLGTVGPKNAAVPEAIPDLP